MKKAHLNHKTYCYLRQIGFRVKLCKLNSLNTVKTFSKRNINSEDYTSL